MPRRHNRDGLEPQPLALTPAEIKPRRRERTLDRKRSREAQARYEQAQYAAARRKRVSEAIRWDMCCIPGCLAKIPKPMDVLKDVDRHLPICSYHAVIVKRQIDTRWNDDEILALREQVQAHQDQLIDGQQRAIIVRENSRHGQLYFLRLNGLIKVGWSSDLEKRLKAYGPDVQLLCHYPGSRQDETLLHRQLRPYLAKGREWYEDCRLIEDIVAATIKQHGPPRFTAYWTEPKPPVIRTRRRSA